VTYAARWARVWFALSGLGVGFASLQWSPFVVVLAVLMIGACTATVLLLDWRRSTRPEASPMRRRGVAPRSLATGCAAVAMSTLAADSPALALLVLLLASLSSPPVVRRLRRAGTSPVDPPPADLTDPTAPVVDVEGEGPQPEAVLAQLDDHELFQLWRGTFWQLGRQPTLKELTWLVSLRQSCLDELGRRNPAALQAWLDSGARASGGPEKFWRTGADPRPAERGDPDPGDAGSDR
jgi:hypothetical protein